MNEFKIGIFSLGDYTTDPETGNIVSEQERIEELINSAKLAEKYNLDIFGLGESHQEHFVSQAHTLILSAIARETSNIILTSSATILSTSDPVRVYENFSTLDILSNGRAEIVAGRASRIGLFKLLGYSMENYEALFEEKYSLLNQINNQAVVNWEGKFRQPLEDAVLLPKPIQKKLPIWRAVGGPVDSARKAGIQGSPMMLATIAGPVSHFNKTVQVYRENFKRYNDDLDNMRIGISNLGFVGETDDEAYKKFFKYIDHTLKQSNGHGLNPEAYVGSLDVRSTLLVGSPETIINKIVYQYETYKNERVLFQLDLGGMPYAEVARQIKIIGEVIAPEVKARIQAIKDKEEQ